MAMNKMTTLLDKIERRLGTKPLILPEEVAKDKWAKEAISGDTIPTYSRYFPHMITIIVDTSTAKTLNDYYIIDSEMMGGQELLGIKDIDWSMYGRDQLVQQNGIGLYDYFSAYSGYSLDDVMLLQARADMTSVFNNSIYIDTIQPNMFRLESVTRGIINGGVHQIPLQVFTNHPANLMTIPATQMETFEQLAIADVASFLVEYLKYFDDLETVFANVNYKLDRLEAKASTREEIVRKLEDSYVNPANENQPIIYTV